MEAGCRRIFEVIHERRGHADERRRTETVHKQLDQAVKAAKAALAPMFDKGAYDLSEDELSLLSEVSFKLGMLRIAIIDRI